ncbi:CD3324 family protein [Sporosarcina aquimarina]|uniref:CD3324 family protein n=1 Tax=Sporosarcina aquimarina TaxID=114975 RepID=UPI00203E3082|nr:CD3324 family protein [Sporosarcina aquimarina]MCM3758207.1 CD3324 family protein [Sporosarcina aquimarina]
MTYMNAQHVLPEQLIIEIQKYVHGETLYIPKLENEYEKWGASSGSRRRLNLRNATIRDSYKKGTCLEDLAQEHYLSVETIKKIVYSHQKK